MKKIIFGLTVLTAFILSSCGNSTTANKKPIADSIVKPVAKSITDSLLNLANKTANSDSLNKKTTSADSVKEKKK